MKPSLPIFFVLSAASALSNAQNTDRQSPQDDNPACMERNVDSNSPGCLLNQPSSTGRVIAQPANQSGNSFQPAPGLKAAPPLTTSVPTLPPVGNQPLVQNPVPTLPPVGNKPLVANPVPTLPAAGSNVTPQSNSASSPTTRQEGAATAKAPGG